MCQICRLVKVGGDQLLIATHITGVWAEQYGGFLGPLPSVYLAISK